MQFEPFMFDSKPTTRSATSLSPQPLTDPFIVQLVTKRAKQGYNVNLWNEVITGVEFQHTTKNKDFESDMCKYLMTGAWGEPQMYFFF